ncbi:hypothetical protein AYI69_g1420 [Smittium culicis]|uniref:Uncharacterized protein n=1 Tax=Smittium culicis TaxID=133412 RepID=A0A1R1YQF7_9FUNG|nr:hypothetical protein AYI69_g1420 [Smittium culicis]
MNSSKITAKLIDSNSAEKSQGELRNSSTFINAYKVFSSDSINLDNVSPHSKSKPPDSFKSIKELANNYESLLARAPPDLNTLTNNEPFPKVKIKSSLYFEKVSGLYPKEKMDTDSPHIPHSNTENIQPKSKEIEFLAHKSDTTERKASTSDFRIAGSEDSKDFVTNNRQSLSLDSTYDAIPSPSQNYLPKPMDESPANNYVGNKSRPSKKLSEKKNFKLSHDLPSDSESNLSLKKPDSFSNSRNKIESFQEKSNSIDSGTIPGNDVSPKIQRNIYKRDDKSVKINPYIFSKSQAQQPLKLRSSAAILTSDTSRPTSSTHYLESRGYLSNSQNLKIASQLPQSYTHHSTVNKPNRYKASTNYTISDYEVPKLESKIKEMTTKNKIYNSSDRSLYHPVAKYKKNIYSTVKQPDSPNKFQKGFVKSSLNLSYSIPPDTDTISRDNYSINSQKKSFSQKSHLYQSIANFDDRASSVNNKATSFIKFNLNPNMSAYNQVYRNSEFIRPYTDYSSRKKKLSKKKNNNENFKVNKRLSIKEKETKRISNLESLFSDIAVQDIDINPTLSTTLSSPFKAIRSSQFKYVNDSEDDLNNKEDYVSVYGSYLSAESELSNPSHTLKNFSNLPPKINNLLLDDSPSPEELASINETAQNFYNKKDRVPNDFSINVIENRTVNNILNSNTRKNIITDSSAADASTYKLSPAISTKNAFSFRRFIGLKKKKN